MPTDHPCPTRPALFRTISALLLTACFFALGGGAARAALQHFVGDAPELHAQDGVLNLMLRVSVDDEDALRVLLRDGASIELGIKVNIERKRSLWMNENIGASEFSSVLKYDSLTRQYRLTNPASGLVQQDGNMRILLSETWKNMELPLLQTEQFEEDETYLVIIRLTLQHAELPPWLEGSIFWSREVVEPETFKLEYQVNHASLSR